MPDTPNNREELRAREPSKYLNRRSYGERPAKEASDHSKKLEKKTDRAKASIVEAVHVPVHLAPPESLQTKQAMPPSCSTLTEAEQLQAKKVLHLGTQGHFGHVQLFATLWAVACQVSLSGGSPDKNIGVYWPILVAICF